MPQLTQDESLQNWDGLVEACRTNAKLRALFHRELELLSQTAKEARAAQFKKLRLANEKQIATQECHTLFAKGNDLSSRVRLAVKATLGPRDERLTQFGIKPLRRRGEGRGIRKPAAQPGVGE